MAFDFYSIMSNGVHGDEPSEEEWAILGISYGFITDALSEAVEVTGGTESFLGKLSGIFLSKDIFL